MVKQKGIHQMVVGAMPGDAIFNEAQMIRDVLRQWGYASRIYAQGIHPALSRSEVQHYSRYRPRSGDLLIFHYSIGSEVSDYVKTLSVPLMMVYHNVTPPHFLQGANSQLLREVEKGRAELAHFRDRVRLAVADSEYNRLDLVEAGYPRTGVLPIAINPGRVGLPPDPNVLAGYDDDWVNILFVGRVAPHKKQGDVVRAFYHYQRINPRSRLFLVGAWGHAERYVTWLRGLIHYLELPDVHLVGHVPDEALMAYYRLADVFLCLSEHEGFCVPLIECMHFGVPIVAYPATAVPYTLGDAGVLVKQKSYGIIAEMIHLLVTDESLRQRIVARQRERAQDFSQERVLGLLRGYLTEALG